MGYSFEEIAGWLREAGTVGANLCGTEEDQYHAKALWSIRATQVEAMGQQSAAESLVLEELAGALEELAGALDRLLNFTAGEWLKTMEESEKVLIKYQQSKETP